MQTRALFLDRDGVININHGYVHRKEHFEFIDGIFDLTRDAYEQGYKVVVITNQAGIGRGYYSMQQFHDLTGWMCEQFLLRGIEIAKVYFSPYHPTEGLGVYKRDHITRKPQPGMILLAQNEYDLDLKESVLIGDKASDIQAGLAAGVGCNILFAQENPTELSNTAYQRITNLHAALPFLSLSKSQKEGL